MVEERALAGDEFSISLWKELGRVLGIGFSNLVNIFNPERIVIGGGLIGAWKLFIPQARKEMRNRALRLPAQRVKIVKAKLGDDAACLGAAYLLWEKEGG